MGAFSTPQNGAVWADLARPNSKFTLTLLTVYVFLIISRALDLSPLAWLRIPLVLLILLTVLTFLGGGVRFAFSTKMTRLFALFTLWVVVCFPFSVWRGGSVDTVRVAVESFVLFVIIVQKVRTESDWRKLAGACAYAVLVGAIYGFLFGRYDEGRLSLAGGMFGDPNELALTLLAGMPFWWLKASRATAVRKILFWACTLPLLATLLRTGSRAGLLAFGAMLLTSFCMANMGQKVLISITVLAGIAVSTAFLPPYLKARYLSMFSAHGTEDLDAKSREQIVGADLDSSNERQALLQQSIHMTFEHPIFGVGPGVFSFAAWDERKASQGKGGIAYVTHNTYTQVSSETGLPGFILFAIVTFLSVKYSISDYRALKQAQPDLAKCSRYLFVSWITLAVGIFFLSVGYTFMIGVFFALAASLHNVVTASSTKPALPVRLAPERPIPPGPRLRTLREPRRITRFSSSRRS